MKHICIACSRTINVVPPIWLRFGNVDLDELDEDEVFALPVCARCVDELQRYGVGRAIREAIGVSA